MIVWHKKVSQCAKFLSYQIKGPMAIIYPSMQLQLRPSVYVRPCNVHTISDGILYTLHTVAAPALQVSVKTELSYQNNMIIAFFLPL